MNAWGLQGRVVSLALALSYSLFGCSLSQSSHASLGKVRGKVTYEGQPLPRGFLHFYYGTSHVGTSAINPDGSGDYEASVPAVPVRGLVTGDPRPDRSDTPAERGANMLPGHPRSVPHMYKLVQDLDAKQAKLLNEVLKKYGSLKTS